MSDRDDLAQLLFETEKRLVGPERAAIAYGDTIEQDELRRMYLDSADAILAAGWVSPDRHQEALDAMALQVTYTEDGTWDVLRRFREVRAERDSQAETLQRVRDLLDKFANPDSAYRQAGCAPLHPSADALLRATLDEQEAHA